MGSAQSSVKRCDLCNFKIEACDDIVFGPADRTYYTDPVNGLPCREPGPRTELSGIWGTTPRLHHESCARQVPDSHKRPHPVGFRTFEPGLEEDGRRHRWLLRQLASQAPVPPVWPEPKGTNDGPLFREQVATTNDSVWRNGSSFSAYVKIDQPIYVRFIEYEGQRYLRYMSNRILQDNPVPVFTPDMRHRVDTVYYAESYMGVVDLVFGSRRVAPPVHHHPDIYWRSVPFPDPEGGLKAITDGLKMRTLHTYFKNGDVHTGSETGCALPQPHDFPLRYFSVDNALPPERVNLFKFNERGTTGYSVCWNQKIVAIHAHRKGENLNNVYAPVRSYGPTPVWQYLPMETGEYICQTFHHSQRHCNQLYITVKTNRGRQFRLGPQGQLCGKMKGWVVVDRHKNEENHIFYKDHPRNVSQICFDTTRMLEKLRQHQAPPIPDPPFDIEGCVDDFFCSEVFLNDVTSVRPCRRQRAGVNVIVGLLLNFRDGHKETLGQVQLNALESPIHAFGSPEMWLRMEKVSDSYPNVVEVRFSRPPIDLCGEGPYGSRCWFAVNMYDSFEWWYTDMACILQWHGMRTPRVMHRDPLQRMALAVWNNCAGSMDVDSSMIPGYDQREDFGDLIDVRYL
ncbi:hypothetical protein HJFPF1_05158 [Paramyrothecium foliicola]|nr:hypothetical protein HJFPF1_05158 [Paramyrothecium foliicola]